MDLDQFAGSHEAAQHGRRLAAAVAAEEAPVVAADRPAAQGTFGVVVIDRQIRVVAITGERGPVLQQIMDSLGSGFGLREGWLSSA
jgi:hypothetical protein